MSKYVCTKLVLNVCHEWMEYQTSLDMLAITTDQRDEIIIATLTLVFISYVYRQIMNIILRRRY